MNVVRVETPIIQIHYKCGNCDKFYCRINDAENCCLCKHCKNIIKKTNTYYNLSRICEKCELIEDISKYKSQIENMQKNVLIMEEKLQKMKDTNVM